MTDPGRARPGDRARRGVQRPPTLALALVLVLGAAATGGCSDDGRAPASPVRSSGPVSTLSPAAQLAAHTARAQDRHYTAEYRFGPPGGAPAGSARVVRTPSGVRFDVLHPATGGTLRHTTVAVRSGAVRYRCVLTDTAGGCVGVDAGGAGDSAAERLQHVFDDWLAVLTSRTAALSVAPVPAPAGVAGRCWSVEAVAASLDPPVDPGLYCFDASGVLTAVRLAAGTLTLVAAGAAPGGVELPAAPGTALPATAVPSPPPSTPSPGSS